MRAPQLLLSAASPRLLPRFPLPLPFPLPCAGLTTTSAAPWPRLPPGIVRPVLSAPHAVLSGVSPAVRDACDPLLLSAAADLLATVRQHSALGLAAPQIGLPLRLFAMRRPLSRTPAEARARLLAGSSSSSRGEARRRRRAGEGGAGGARGGGGADDAASGGGGGTDSSAAGGRAAPSRFLVCIDPAITSRGQATAIGVEACLSLPDAMALVRRHCDITVAYTDAVTGERVEEALGGLPAVVFQHELDHLDGILLPDRQLTRASLAMAAIARGAEQRQVGPGGREGGAAARRQLGGAGAQAAGEGHDDDAWARAHESFSLGLVQFYGEEGG